MVPPDSPKKKKREAIPRWQKDSLEERPSHIVKKKGSNAKGKGRSGNNLILNQRKGKAD